MKPHICKENSALLGVPLLALALGVLASCGGGSMNTPTSNGFSNGTGPIGGTVVDDSTGQPVAGAMVLLEQQDMSGIDRVQNSTGTASDGSFTFSSLSSGNYDLVAAASILTGSGATITYATTVTFQVPVGSTVAGIPLVPEFGNSTPDGQPASIGGKVTSGPAPIDVKLSALQSATPEGGQGVTVTIPALAGSTPEVTTVSGSLCPSGSACANYMILVPSSNPATGIFDASGTSYTFPSSGPTEVIYSLEGRAFVHGLTTSDCMPSIQTVTPIVLQGTLPTMVPDLSFTSCR